MLKVTRTKSSYEGFEGLIQNPLKHTKDLFPVPVFCDMYLLLLFSPLQGLYKLKEHFIVSLL